MALEEAEVGETDAQTKKNVVRAIEAVAARLGNTPAICRKSYVHPRVLDPDTWRERDARRASAPRGLRAEEAAFLAIIRPVRTASRTRRLRPTSPGPARPGASAGRS